MRLRQPVRLMIGPTNIDEVDIVRRVLPRRGVMIDVGAHYGTSLQRFARQAWSIFAFEPDPENRERLLGAVRRFPNVTVDGRAVAESDDLELDLFVSDVSTGISSLLAFHESHQLRTRVKTVRLDTYMRDHDIRKVDLLKVDAEGFDLPILRTFPWNEAKPSAVVCEFEDRKTKDLLGYGYHELAEYLVGHGFVVFVSEWYPIDRYGESHLWRRFQRYPAELIESEGWGNLIAVRPSLADATARALGRAQNRWRAFGPLRRIR